MSACVIVVVTQESRPRARPVLTTTERKLIQHEKNLSNDIKFKVNKLILCLEYNTLVWGVTQFELGIFIVWFAVVIVHSDNDPVFQVFFEVVCAFKLLDESFHYRGATYEKWRLSFFLNVDSSDISARIFICNKCSSRLDYEAPITENRTRALI